VVKIELQLEEEHTPLEDEVEPGGNKKSSQSMKIKRNDSHARYETVI